MYRWFYFTENIPNLPDILTKTEIFIEALTYAVKEAEPTFCMPDYQLVVYNSHLGAAVAVQKYDETENKDTLELFHILFHHNVIDGWQAMFEDAMFSAYHDLHKALSINLPDNRDQLVRAAELAYMRTLAELPTIFTKFPHDIPPTE